MSNLLEGKVFVKISELDATTTFDTNDEFILVRNGTTVKTAGIDFVDTVVSIGNLATKTYTDAAVAALVAGAPGALDTLNELSAALNNNAEFASTITNQLSLKLNVGDFGLYFWNELNAITTYHVAEGSNLYYTEQRVDANFATKNTDALAEGTTNLYYTDTRVLDAMAPLLFSGDYNDLTNTPTIPPAYVLPTATTSVLGGVKVDGTTIKINNQVISGFSGAYTDLTNRPNLSTVATSGSYNDLLNKPTIPTAYTLPTASNSTLGGIKVGLGLSIDGSGVLSATGGGGSIGPTPTFTTVTTTNLNVQNVTFTGTGAVTITSGNDLNFVAAGSILANGSSVITKAQLKAVVSASTDFADFKARIAAL
jgi:hypothetical protein